MPHAHIGGVQLAACGLAVIAGLGGIKLVALAHPNNPLAQAWLVLF